MITYYHEYIRLVVLCSSIVSCKMWFQYYPVALSLFYMIYEVTDHLLYDLFIIINFGLVVNWRTMCLSFFLSERCKLEFLYQ